MKKTINKKILQYGSKLSFTLLKCEVCHEKKLLTKKILQYGSKLSFTLLKCEVCHKEINF